MKDTKRLDKATCEERSSCWLRNFREGMESLRILLLCGLIASSRCRNYHLLMPPLTLLLIKAYLHDLRANYGESYTRTGSSPAITDSAGLAILWTYLIELWHTTVNSVFITYSKKQVWSTTTA